MQGTVATFDEREHDGSLLLDDGTPVAFPAGRVRRVRVCGCCGSASGYGSSATPGGRRHAGHTADALT